MKQRPLMVDVIPHNRPLITPADEQAVQGVLKSGHIAQGPEVEGLEADFVTMMGDGSACALSSGSASLFLALYGLGIGKGQKVAVPTYACSALLNAVYMSGGTPSVVDVTEDTFILDPDRLDDQAPEAAAAIVVHCFGASADVKNIRDRGILVVEDCCQSIGGSQGSEGDVSVYSFHATKTITGGNGGLVWARSSQITEQIVDFRQHDCRDNYIPRFNFQMTDVQATMVRSQLSRLSEITSRRQHIYERYKNALPDFLSLQTGLSGTSIAPYRFVVRAEDQETRDFMQSHMSSHGVTTIVPIERYELLHRYLELDAGAYPNAEKIVNTTLSLPLFPGLSDSEIDRILVALSKIK